MSGIEREDEHQAPIAAAVTCALAKERLAPAPPGLVWRADVAAPEKVRLRLLAIEEALAGLTPAQVLQGRREILVTPDPLLIVGSAAFGNWVGVASVRPAGRIPPDVVHAVREAARQRDIRARWKRAWRVARTGGHDVPPHWLRAAYLALIKRGMTCLGCEMPVGGMHGKDCRVHGRRLDVGGPRPPRSVRTQEPPPRYCPRCRADALAPMPQGREYYCVECGWCGDISANRGTSASPRQLAMGVPGAVAATAGARDAEVSDG